MATSDFGPNLDQAHRQLNAAADSLAGSVLGLDEDRLNCRRLADHFDDFAGRMAGEYGSLVAPASRLGELLRELDQVLERLSTSTEDLTACAGRLADQVAAFRQR